MLFSWSPLTNAQVSNASLLYFVGFVGNLPFLPKTVDSGFAPSLPFAILLNIAFIAIFGLQHSFMARPEFKRWSSRFLEESMERSTYVILASLLLFMLSWHWQPLPMAVWNITNPPGYFILRGLFWLGWGLAIFSSGLIDILDLTGLRQVSAYLKGVPHAPPEFKIQSIYRYIRHPIMLGTLIGLWATPTMTAGHLLLSVGFSTYIFVGIVYEERDLAGIIGEKYRDYQRTTKIIIPFVF
ncbi:Methanethiol S-methyltransferase [Gammaproteobacteria bacterium]